MLGIIILPIHQSVAQDCSCGAPCYVLLDNDSLYGVENFIACLTIEVGPNVVVEELADVTFNAGESIIVNNDVLINENATVALKIDPLLFCDLTTDFDEDQSDACLDCNDDDSSVFPGAEETCDGLDNDCNPSTADGSEDPNLGTACDGPDSDLCSEGTQVCSGGALECSDNTDNNLEICDGVDNDCDPSSADGSEDPGYGTACDGPDSDLCSEGTQVCSGGALECSDNTENNLDICDGVDNDCDPSSADGSEDPGYGTACDGPDSDLCSEGTQVCSGGALECSDNTDNNLDICDGVDNDCDPSSADGSEDPGYGTACDGPDSDLCSEGTQVCSGGVLECSDNTENNLDICDGVDNDCNASTADGSQDPDYGTACDGPDTDLCEEGTWSCIADNLVCSDNTGNDLEICDGVDNDCDGSIDEGC